MPNRVLESWKALAVQECDTEPMPGVSGIAGSKRLEILQVEKEEHRDNGAAVR